MKDSHNLVQALRRHGLGTWPEKNTTIKLPGGVSAQPDDPKAIRYALAGLDRECDTVKAAIQGTRNDTLNRSSYKIGTLVGAGLLDGDNALQALTIAGSACGLPPNEVDRTVARAIADGAHHPRHVMLTKTDIGDGHVLAMADASNTAEQLDIAALHPRIDWHEAFAAAPDDIPWLAHPVIEQGRLYAMYSPAKAGKSLLTLDICAALASGRSCLGNPPIDPVSVVYVDLENSVSDLVERLTDMGYQPDDLHNLSYHSFPSLPALDSRQGGLQITALAMHYRAKLVVIDTVSRVIAGKEYDSDTFHALYRYTMMPLKSMGITVLRLDHAGKDTDKGMRGSSAKSSDVDTAWKLERTSDTRFRLHRVVSRTSNAPESILIEQSEAPLRHVILPSGAPDGKVASAISVMDKLDIPRDWGRDKVRRALANGGYKLSNSVLHEAIRTRKLEVPG